MRKLLTLISALCWLPLMAMATVEVTRLRVENMDSPLAVATSEPRFSWQLTSDQQGVRQTGYQLVVSDDRGELWNTGHVESDEQLWIAYRGPRLRGGTHCRWRVKVYTNRGETAWSTEQHFGIGLLTESQWGGRWIGLERLMPDERQGQHTRMAARYLRREFRTEKPVKRAIAYVAGLGLHELHVNGRTYDDHVMQPMPTDYRKTVLYNTYDITRELRTDNCVGIVLGNGRYFAMRQNKPYKNTTFGLPKCRVNIIIDYEDGSRQRVNSDEQWRVTADGPIRANNEYDGEVYDARKEMPGWDVPGYDDSHWLPAERTAIPTGTLRPQMAAGMVAVHHAALPSPTHTTSSRPSAARSQVYDFHQNMAGWLAFTPTGQEGDTIRIRYAERLNADGTLYTKNLRDAQSEDLYICRRNAPPVRSAATLSQPTSPYSSNAATSPDAAPWHPTFVTHGFRYAEVTGPATDIRAYTVSDDVPTTGSFACSDSTLNQVVRNAWWGIYGNYKGVPVDCPQRNERQPWLGDRTVGSLGESFLFGNERLYTKWMRDICESQREDGVFSDVAPAYWNYYNDDVTWPAALPFTCDMLWRQYGNTEAVTRSYPYMARWLRHLLDEYLKDGIITRDKYGDWCVPPERLELIHSQDPERKTDGSLISTAYVIRILQLMEQFARLQQLTDDATYYRQRRDMMTHDFNRHFLTAKTGTSARPGHPFYPDSVYYGNNTVTANLLPLSFGIVPDSLRQEVAKQVVEHIMVRDKGHVSCGVIGISWLLRGLSDHGYADVAWLLATQRTYPSWGYMAEQGATTIWELWNGDKASPEMNSGNHVMLLGDLLTWCYQYLGGLRQTATDRPAAEGTDRRPADGASRLSAYDDVATAYKTMMLRPAFDIQGCDSVAVSYDTPYGTVVSRWRKTLQHVEWDVEIPCNTTATVCLPDGSSKTVGSGRHHFSSDIPARDAAIVRDEFLYTDAPFASPHAATIVETRQGDLVAAYFGGTYERDPDCNIWVSIKRKGSGTWSQPILADDGDGVACWNPVLTEMPDGELWLFYKIGKRVSDWTGWLVKSRDGGRTWSRREALPEGFLGPIKNKPLLLEPVKGQPQQGRRLLCGSSTEGNGWRFHVEIYDLDSRQWRYVGPVESTVAMKTDDEQPHPIDCIQPSFLQLADGRLQVLMRTHNGRLATSYSSDRGDTWTPVTLSEVENNQSGTDAVTLRDGRHVLIYNNFETLMGTRKGPRTPLSLAVSDDGQHWRHWLTLEDSPAGEFSYPSIIQGRNGHLHCVYTWQRKRVAYKEIKLRRPAGRD